MKNITKYCTLLFFLSISIIILSSGSCLQIKDPEFVKMKDWKIEHASDGFIKVTSKAQFYNPNKVGVMLTNTYADIYLDSQKIGNINQVNTIKVPKESSFDVPLEVTIRTDDKLNLLLKNAFKFLTNKNATIYYKGFIQIKKTGIPIKVKMEDKYVINLKDIKLFSK